MNPLIKWYLHMLGEGSGYKIGGGEARDGKHIEGERR